MNEECRIAAIQSISIAGDIAANVERHARLARAAARDGARLALFPELSLTGYELAIARDVAIHEDDARLEELGKVAVAHGITIVAGVPLRGHLGDVYVAALSFLPDGSVLTYTKQHLHSGEEAAFTAGGGGALLEIDGESVALAVCADISHPSHPQIAAGRGARIYAASVLISEGGYEPDTKLLREYAERHHMPVVMANHGGMTGVWKPAGRSAIWDAGGNLVIAAPADDECMVMGIRENGKWRGSAISERV
jgi:predicted amidohydrolase